MAQFVAGLRVFGGKAQHGPEYVERIRPETKRLSPAILVQLIEWADKILTE